ncbi:hypothetical protein STCU_00647 [Strigomonas culicis]|uniref:Amastin-like surface protein-like protein n=1 Tax=Strigomonas culicis TaxID=28005 RepID=S9UGN6_9TRYP|nr:hypothetical protein STCU_04297 [Strigomonas culicis]EPY36315.1 hypothetical protein STCU_00647 [Strigomonas culicis]|eukprot:EPY29977.1 hypothetical protein STCU_04297 [Strigomonas culicis]
MPSHEPVHDDGAGNHAPADDAQDTESMTSSLCELHVATKDAGNADLRSRLEPHSGRVVTIVFVVAAAISSVLMLAACCPVPWYTPVAGGSSLTLWRDASNTKWTNTDCSRRAQMFQAMEAFAIASCVSSVAALVAGVLQLVGGGHLGVTVGLGVFTTAMELVTWALCVNQFHVYNCPGKGGLDPSVGCMLALTACCVMLFATVGVPCYLYAFPARREVHECKCSRRGLATSLLLLAGMALTVAGSASAMWAKDEVGITTRVTLWRIEFVYLSDGERNSASFESVWCSLLLRYFRVGQAFAIVSGALLFVTFLLSINALYVAGLREVCVLTAAASWVTLLACWAVMVGVHRTTFCGDSDLERSAFQDYHIAHGLEMSIAAWCILVPAMILLLLK